MNIPTAARDAEASAAQARSALRRTTLGRGTLTLYGVGAMTDAVCTFCLSSLLYFYLTAVCGLSGAAAGASLALTLVVDSAIDPLVGSISDNSRSRHGRRHPFMFAAALPVCAALGLLFSVPRELSGIGLFAYATACTLTLRAALSLFGVPFIALGAELTEDYHRRSTVVGFRVGISVLGTLTAILLTYGVFLKGSGGLLRRDAYAPLAWSLGLVAAVTAVTASIGTLAARDRLHAAPSGPRTSFGGFLAELDEVRRNGSFVVLFCACLLFFVAQGMAAAIGLHANTYFWRLNTGTIELLALAGLAGVVIGLPVVGVLSPRLEKRTIAVLGLLGICLAQATVVPLRLVGVLPNDPSAIRAALVAANLLGGVGTTAAVVGFQSMMADAADEHEHMFSSRREGLYFAGISFSVKASSGLGVLFAGLAMDAVGFPHDLANHAAAAQITPARTVALGLLHGPTAAAVTLLGVLVLLRYRLDRHSHTAILESLAERRQFTQVPGTLA